MDMAHKMGITQQRLFPHLTLSIGDIEATPLEMATVIATDRQRRRAPGAVLRAEGDGARRHHAIRFDETNRAGGGDRVLDQDVAECEQIVLRGVITGGTGTGYTEVSGHEPFGKTGTTDNLGDAWFIGATPQLATAVWFGNRTTNRSRAGFGGPTSRPDLARSSCRMRSPTNPTSRFPTAGARGVQPPGQVGEPGRRARAASVAAAPTDSSPPTRRR